MVLLRIDAVARQIGSRVLFRDVSVAVQAGDRIGLVGPNGAGKTTLLRIAGGEEEPDAGSVHAPRHVRVGLLRQEIDPTRGASVREEVASVLVHLEALEAELREIEAGMAAIGRRGEDVPPELADRYDRGRAAFEFGGGFDRAARVERVLAGLGFAEGSIDRPLSSFSGGWLMRVELAKLLLSAPDVLLLDEPTNHLDLPSIQWFEETLAEYRGGIVVISHDRAFLRRHATRMATLERGRIEVVDRGYDAWIDYRAERREQLFAQKRNQDRRIAETERFIERFRYKASKARQVQSRVKALERIERVEVPEEQRATLRLRLPPPARAGESVLRLEGIHKRFGDNVVYAGVDFEVRRGERVALAGPNGAGKSTLLRIAAGGLRCDAGERRLGHNVRVAFFGQHQLENLDARSSVLEELSGVASTDDHARLRGHLGAFLFSGDDVEKKVAVLSGGEKSRLALAKMLLRPANFLILDEPTNHLDLAAREVLEGALAGYTGTLLFISHDRDFIDALATRVVDVRAGMLTSYPGNYSDYQRAHRRSAAVASGAALAADDAPASTAEASRPAADAKRARMEARARAKELGRRLERARKRVAAIEEEILGREEQLESLAHQLARPDVYSDGDLVRAVEAERTETRAAIERLYADWETAAAEIEALERDQAAENGGR